jgi:hypothetical protein
MSWLLFYFYFYLRFSLVTQAGLELSDPSDSVSQVAGIIGVGHHIVLPEIFSVDQRIILSATLE